MNNIKNILRASPLFRGHALSYLTRAELLNPTKKSKALEAAIFKHVKDKGNYNIILDHESGHGYFANKDKLIDATPFSTGSYINIHPKGGSIHYDYTPNDESTKKGFQRGLAGSIAATGYQVAKDITSTDVNKAFAINTSYSDIKDDYINTQKSDFVNKTMKTQLGKNIKSVINDRDNTNTENIIRKYNSDLNEDEIQSLIQSFNTDLNEAVDSAIEPVQNKFAKEHYNKEVAEILQQLPNSEQHKVNTDKIRNYLKAQEDTNGNVDAIFSTGRLNLDKQPLDIKDSLYAELEKKAFSPEVAKVDNVQWEAKEQEALKKSEQRDKEINDVIIQRDYQEDLEKRFKEKYPQHINSDGIYSDEGVELFEKMKIGEA